MAENIVTDETVYLATWCGVQKTTKRTTRTLISSVVEKVEYLAADGTPLARSNEYGTLAEAKARVKYRLDAEIARAEDTIADARREIENYRKALTALEAMTE